jgi:hypothetical protein
MRATLTELPYPTPRGKYCAKHHVCGSCSWPADYIGRDKSVSYLCIRHVADWADAHGVSVPIRVELTAEQLNIVAKEFLARRAS